MMSYVHYWRVGASTDIRLSLTPAQICQALLIDWLPTLPFAASSSVLGWPHHLITAESGSMHPYLYLERIAGWSDRQWKGVLSWMIGIAGTRRVLDDEGYVWIAPASAFYPERRQDVATPHWHTGYPPSRLQILPDPRNGSRVRPDYIAARPSASGFAEFAIVESKGRSDALQSMNRCPQDWALQCRNAIVQLDGSVINIPRHLVVATRCNPNAARPQTRRLQIRAWNTNSNPSDGLPEALLEVASAHYAGLCRNLGLLDNLRALQIAALARFNARFISDSQFAQYVKNADSELMQKGGWEPDGSSAAHFTIELDIGTIHVHVTDVAVSIIRSIRSLASTNEIAQGISRYLNDLVDWYLGITTDITEDTNTATDRSGFLVRAEMRHPVGP